MRPPSRRSVILESRRSGARVGAVLPIHAPRALLWAHGVHPVELWGPPGQDPSPAASCVQAYVCSVIRCGLSFLRELEGPEAASKPSIDLVLVPHSCDSLQGLGSMLLDLAPLHVPVLTFNMPRGQGPAQTAFLAEELRLLGGKLTEITGTKPTPSELARAVESEERIEALCIARIRERASVPASDLAFWGSLRLREYLPPELFFQQLQESELQPKPNVGVPNARPLIPLLLSGIVPEPMSLYTLIEQAGGLVVGDDTAAIGRRLRSPGSSPEPFTRMAEHLLSGPPDPMLGAPIRARAAHLVEMARTSSARAVVFHLIKACEPDLFDLPILQRELDRVGLRSVVIETDLGSLGRAPSGELLLSQQARTRVEALLESLA